VVLLASSSQSKLLKCPHPLANLSDALYNRRILNVMSRLVGFLLSAYLASGTALSLAHLLDVAVWILCQRYTHLHLTIVNLEFVQLLC
jgi:hypothetical protein